MELMMHAPIWWYVWLGVVLLFGMMSILRLLGGKLPHMPKRRVPERLATSDDDGNGELMLSNEDEHDGRDQRVTAAALDEVDHAGRFTMALPVTIRASCLTRRSRPSIPVGWRTWACDFQR